MKCTKRSFALIGVLLGVPLSLSIGRLNARDVDRASGALATVLTAKQQCILYWFRTGMTALPFSAPTSRSLLTASPM